MAKHNNILLAFYGDDFTGSTDALEFICRAGANAMLFIDPPTESTLAAYPTLNAYGIAGKTRSLPTAEMQAVLMPAFEHMKATGAQHIHYKVCSTFDSSPNIGSIGKAIDCGSKVFGAHQKIPILGGTPALGRYCVFAQLFASMGTGAKGEIYRIDRHPSMSNHPVTPALESDLRKVLDQQTQQKIGHINILQYKQSNIDDIISDDDAPLLLIDILSTEQLHQVGQWMNALRKNDQPLFSVGSSAIEMALGKFWNSTQQLIPNNDWLTASKATSLLVLSGSCSPITAAQIQYALQNGFKEIILNMNVFQQEESATIFLQQVCEQLQLQQRIIVHTGQQQAQQIASQQLGDALGKIGKYVAENTAVKRIIVAGGDTSSYAARAMEIEAVAMLAPMVSGAPLCKAFSKNIFIDGLEVNFKGGQVGPENYFDLF